MQQPVVASHDDVRPGGVKGFDRCRRPEEGDGHGVFVRLVRHPALALEYAQDAPLYRDEELADFLLTGALRKFRKSRSRKLRKLRRFRKFGKKLSLPALHVPIACAVTAARQRRPAQRRPADKRRAVVSELYVSHVATDTGHSACQMCQVLEVTQIFKI